MPLDTSLESNFFTALTPNFEVLHKGKLLLQNLGKKIGLVKTKSTSSIGASLRPPGDVPERRDAVDLRRVEPIAAARPDAAHRLAPLARSRETGQDLPMVDSSQLQDVERYGNCIPLAASVKAMDDKGSAMRDLNRVSAGYQDAFQTSVQDKNGDHRGVLPDEVLRSSLVNQSVADGRHDLEMDDLPKKGEIDPRIMTTLADGWTGFHAGITYHPKTNEVIVAFGGTGSHKMGLRQLARGALNFLGLLPKPMSQGAKLTRMVKEHIDKLNKDLPPDKQIKLTLTGWSMGGGVASYASLRHGVPAVVFNPMRAGWAARAKIGQPRLDEADKYLTEVCVQGDWVSDTNASKLLVPTKIAGFNSRGPLGNARRLMLPAYDFTPHSGFLKAADQLGKEYSTWGLKYPAMNYAMKNDPSDLSRRAQGDLVAKNYNASMRRYLGPKVDATLGPMEERQMLAVFAAEDDAFDAEKWLVEVGKLKVKLRSNVPRWMDTLMSSDASDPDKEAARKELTAALKELDAKHRYYHNKPIDGFFAAISRDLLDIEPRDLN